MGDDETLGSIADEGGRPIAASRGGGGGGILSNKPLLAMIGVGIIVFVVIITLMMRGGGSGGGMHFVPIVENLTPLDVALIRAELRYNSISSRTEGRGKSLKVLVPVRYKDDALDILALRGLPAGNIQGFRLFDKQDGLGTTDFDKRIKYVRALNGELALIITRLRDIEDARVQIVIPEKQMFSKSVAKVSASVLLKLKKGSTLKFDQIQGIVQLVASSVEGLKVENITIVDTGGYILHGPESDLSKSVSSAKTLAYIEKDEEEITEKLISAGAVKKAELEKTDTGQTLLSETATTATKTKEKEVTLEDLVYTQLRFKKDMEEQLEKKAQRVLSHYFPKDASMVKVNLRLPPISEKQTKKDITKIDQISVMILVNSDNERVSINAKLKKDVFHAVAGVVGYQYGGRDRIDLRKAPFYFTQKEIEHEAKAKGKITSWQQIMMIAGGIVLLIIIIFYWRYRKEAAARRIFETSEKDVLAQELEREQQQADFINPELKEIRESVQNNPEQIAGLINNWLKEEMP
ncbi:flagellar basal-body MS-ring/collar protein FliF [Candidatus Margulisiibacteriota bacterium]